MVSKWLKEKSEILARYAESFPEKQDRVQISFDYPEDGWMRVHFFKNGDDMSYVEFSYIGDCFVPIREWLETIVSSDGETAIAIRLNMEKWHAVLSYEPIWFYESDEYKGNLLLWDYGIFSVFDEEENRFLLDAFCKTETFVSDVYKCIIDFAKSMQEKPEFIEDWISDVWNEEWAKLDDKGDEQALKEFFMNKVKSPIIEKYIR